MKTRSEVKKRAQNLISYMYASFFSALTQSAPPIPSFAPHTPAEQQKTPNKYIGMVKTKE